ncbi:MAG: glutamyl-tRNA reductase [Bacillota bacterium]
MELTVIGVNHKKTPLEVREKLSLTTTEREELLATIKSIDKLEEGVVVSTCNRTELYIVAKDRSYAQDFALKKLNQISGFNINFLEEYIYTYYGFETVEHLYQVASGLDSLVIGETQILGQLKTAFKEAKQEEATKKYLNKLFPESFKVGKRARNETKINQNAASISYAAVELARKIFGKLSGETVLILGAGEMSELTLKSLVDYGVKGVMVANRTYQHGQELAEEFDGKAITWNEVDKWIKEVDIIIGSTAAPHCVLHYDMIKEAMKRRRGPLFLIDIAVPRDMESEVNEIPGVHLYDIDDLKEVIEENLNERKEEKNKVQKIINEEVIEFKSWLNNQQCVPVIKKMRSRAEKIKEEELNRALDRLSDSNKDSEEVITDLANRLVNKVLHNPTMGIKELANCKQNTQKLEVVKELFA